MKIFYFLCPVRLRRVTDKEFPLMVILEWKPTDTSRFRLVLQENETGEIVVSDK